jgi:hypothetical protein
LQGQAANTLHIVQARVTYTDFIWGSEVLLQWWLDSSGLTDETQSKDPTSLQKSVAVIQQFAQWALVELSVDFTNKEATHALINNLSEASPPHGQQQVMPQGPQPGP